MALWNKPDGMMKGIKMNDNFAVLVCGEYSDLWEVKEENLSLDIAIDLINDLVNNYELKPEQVKLARLDYINFKIGVIIED